MKPGDAVYEELCQTLRQEASEQVERIGAALLELEQGPTGQEREALVQEAFRQAHNLKGAASSLGFTLTARLAHAIESLLDDLRDASRDAADPLLDAVHQGLAAVNDAIEADPEAKSDPRVTPVIEELIRKHETSSAESPSLRRTTAPSRTLTDPPANLLAGLPAIDPTSVSRPLTGPSRSSSGGFTQPQGEAGGWHAWAGAEGEAAEEQWAQQSPGRSAPEETLRVSLRKLDALMAQVGELLAARLRTDQRLSELRSVLANEEARLERRKALRSMVRDTAPPHLDPWVQRLVDTLGDGTEHQQGLVRQLRDLVRAFEADALHSTILSGELQEDIRRIQTFPLASVLSPLPRAVRNMAREASKDAQLVVEGADVELDKKVLEALRDPLNHLLRNAVDHGLEPPHVRRDRGKPVRGTIRIHADHRGNQIAITIRDDGPGVDLEAVRRRAIQRGLVSEAAAVDMSEHRLLQLLFAPGFTTRSTASALSGRGIGLDAVRTVIEGLHGTVTVHSEPGRGTTVLIALPLTVYVVQALVLRVGDHTLALPISAIHRILRITPAEVLEVEQSEAVVIDGQPVALLSLASLLRIDSDRSIENRIPVVVVGAGDQRFALAVDEIVSDETLLAKSFEPPLMRLRNIGGATILGDGSVVLMLNPVDLLRSASMRDGERAWVVPKRAERTRPRVLLADDSFTTRALERSVLEAAGFDVVAVADGQEALTVLESNPDFDAVVSDVSMPRVTGLDLCQRIRATERLRALPVILVSSLGSEEDLGRGLAAGADAYVVKSEFDHEKLVGKVNELLGRA